MASYLYGDEPISWVSVRALVSQCFTGNDGSVFPVKPWGYGRQRGALCARRREDQLRRRGSSVVGRLRKDCR